MRVIVSNKLFLLLLMPKRVCVCCPINQSNNICVICIIYSTRRLLVFYFHCPWPNPAPSQEQLQQLDVPWEEPVWGCLPITVPLLMEWGSVDPQWWGKGTREGLCLQPVGCGDGGGGVLSAGQGRSGPASWEQIWYILWRVGQEAEVDVNLETWVL